MFYNSFLNLLLFTQFIHYHLWIFLNLILYNIMKTSLGPHIISEYFSLLAEKALIPLLVVNGAKAMTSFFPST